MRQAASSPVAGPVAFLDRVRVLVAFTPTGHTVPLWQATSNPSGGREDPVERSRQGSRILSHLSAGGLGESGAMSSLPAAADAPLGLRAPPVAPRGP